MVREDRESSPKTHPQLRRYRKAGASAVALYRFAAPSMDEFFMSEVMQNYSEAVFIEGDCPIDCVDLTVFVTSPPPTRQRSSSSRRKDTATGEDVALLHKIDCTGSRRIGTCQTGPFFARIGDQGFAQS